MLTSILSTSYMQFMYVLAQKLILPASSVTTPTKAPTMFGAKDPDSKPLISSNSSGMCITQVSSLRIPEGMS